ncbi:MAG: MBL fold metallo-hydrolase [Bacilli bacterium]|nr:MBL fold metallo-hydrolase [Bacilli bacterium]
MKRIRIFILLLIMIPVSTMAKTNEVILPSTISIVMEDNVTDITDTDDNSCVIDNAEAFSCGNLRRIPKGVQFASNIFVNIIKYAIPAIMLISYIYNYLLIRFNRDKFDVIEARLYYLRVALVPCMIFGAVFGTQIAVAKFAAEDGANALLDCADCFLNNKCNVIYNPSENPCKDDRYFIINGKEVENENYDKYIEKYENTSSKKTKTSSGNTQQNNNQNNNQSNNDQVEPVSQNIDSDSDEEEEYIPAPVVISNPPEPEPQPVPVTPTLPITTTTRRSTTTTRTTTKTTVTTTEYIPSTPSTPSTSSTPSTPSIPSTPSTPSIPSTPSTPSTPTYSGNPIDVYFLNTMTNPLLKETHTSNQAILIKTYDEKYVLLDTGDEDSGIVQIIYNKLKELQGTTNVYIDYLILSHMHNDHFGNMKAIMGHKNITVRNAICKYDQFQSGWYNTHFAEPLKANGINEYKVTYDGQELQLGDMVSLKFYNTTDIYKKYDDQGICKRNYLGVKFKLVSKVGTSQNFGTKNDPLYIYIDGGKYKNGTFEYYTTTKYISKKGGSGINQYFYATKVDDRKNCNSNGNSYGILVTVNSSPKKKYIYLPSDLENIGYDLFPNKDGIYGNMGYSRVYGSNGDAKSKLSYSVKDKDFTPISKNLILEASETKVATSIRNYLGSKTEDIVIYQMAHHGGNSAPDAINTLGLNRSDLYAIAMRSTDTKNSKFAPGYIEGFNLARTYYYTLSSAKKMAAGYSENGIKCTITVGGSTSCNHI